MRRIFFIVKPVLLIICFLSLSYTVCAQKRCSIGFLVDENNVESRTFCKEVEEEVHRIIGKELLVLDQPMRVYENDFDGEKAKENYLRLQEDSSVDIIISQGAVSNFIVESLGAPTKSTLVVGKIIEELSNSLWSGERKKNISYVITPFSIKKDLITFQGYVSYHNVAILVNPMILNIFPLNDYLDTILKGTNIKYEIVPLEANKKELGKKLSQHDAAYLLTGEEYELDSLQKIIDGLNQMKIPTFSSVIPEAARLGVLFSKGVEGDHKKVIRRIALNIESIMNGTPAKELPTKVIQDDNINFNIKTSYQIDFNPKYSQLFGLNISGNVLDFNAAETYDLKRVLEQVVDQNFKLQSEKQNIKIAEENTKYAKSSYLPKATASANAMNLDPAIAEVMGQSNKSINSSVKASVEQVIYSQEASSNIKIQKYQQKATEAQYSTQVLNMMSEGGGAYYQMLVAKTNYQIADENLSLTRKNYAISKNNYEAGETGKADVLRWKSELANATQLLVNSYFALKQNAYNLNQIVGNSIQEKIDVKSIESNDVLSKKKYFKPLFDIIDDPKQRVQVVQIVTNIAIESSPELEALGYNLLSADRTMKMYNRSKYMPTIALQGSYNYTIDQQSTVIPSNYYSIGLNMSIPLYDRNQRNIQKRKAAHQYQQISFEQQNIQSVISKDVNTLLGDIVAKASNIRLSRISSESAFESLNLMQISYASGATSITSLIDAQKAYIKAKQDEANAVTEFLGVSLNLQRYINYFFPLHTEAENMEYLMNLKSKIMQ
ncbi:TolC family protein [Halosquirtibacter laminarini]|uniref:TolC family protein n=1 Tax=Halosquirtibacter laminarini TaxID=3374600 RepID=A0AC61NBD3_9BACT|nr:TolC family protein [Prolixibacteraceae bacterium]